MVSTDHFRHELLAQFGRAATQGRIDVLINSGELYRSIARGGSHSGSCRDTMQEEFKMGDTLHVRLPSGTEVTGPVIYKAVEADFATQRDVSRTKRDIRTFERRTRAGLLLLPRGHARRRRQCHRAGDRVAGRRHLSLADTGAVRRLLRTCPGRPGTQHSDRDAGRLRRGRDNGCSAGNRRDAGAIRRARAGLREVLGPHADIALAMGL